MASQPRPEVEEPEYEPASANEEHEVSRRHTVKRSRLKLRSPLLLIPLALLMTVGTVLLWLYFGSYESTDDAQVDVHLYPVSARISG